MLENDDNSSPNISGYHRQKYNEQKYRHSV
jgi:hypothetical protein